MTFIVTLSYVEISTGKKIITDKIEIEISTISENKEPVSLVQGFESSITINGKLIRKEYSVPEYFKRGDVIKLILDAVSCKVS